MNTLKKIALIIVLVVLITSGLNLLIKKLTPKNIVEVQTPEITNPNISETTIEKITINTELPSIPNEMEIYSSSSEENAIFLANKMAALFNLVENPDIENIWADETGTWFLSYSPISDQITLSNLKAENNEFILESDPSVEAAQNFVDSLKLPFVAELDEVHVEVKTVDGYADSHPHGIPFVQKINGYDLYLSNKLESTMSVFIAKNYQVAKIVINNPSNISTSLGYSETIDQEQVKENIIDKKGTIIGIDDHTGSTNPYENISSLIINNVVVEYREDPSLQLVIPFYRFEGTATSDNGKSLDIDIVYPVIETQK